MSDTPKGTFLTVVHNPVYDSPIKQHRELLDMLDKRGIAYEFRPRNEFVSEVWRLD